MQAPTSAVPSVPFHVPTPKTTTLGRFPNQVAKVLELLPILDAMEKDRYKLEAKIRRIKETLLNPQSPPTERFNPKTGFNMTMNQLEMYWAFEVGGTIMLAERIYEFAAIQYKKGDKGWKSLVEDEQLPYQQRVLPFVLHTIHPAVIRQLITRTLPWAAHQNTHEAAIIRLNTQMSPNPGTYLAQFGLKPPFQIDPNKEGGQIKDATGCGFSAKVWTDIFAKSVAYVEGTDNKTALQIDTHYSGASKEQVEFPITNSSERRFRGSTTERDIQHAFGVFSDMFLDKIKGMARHDEIASQPLLYSSTYAAHNKNPNIQTISRRGNADASKFLGLTNSIVFNFYPNWQMYTYQIVFLCEDAHKDIAEAAVSVLASTYSEEGGFNGNRAGGLPAGSTAAQFKYDINCKEVLGNTRGVRAPNAENLHDNIRKTEYLKKLIELKDEPSCEELEKEIFEKMDGMKSRYSELKERARRHDLFWITNLTMELLEARNEAEKEADKKSGIHQRYLDVMSEFGMPVQS